MSLTVTLFLSVLLLNLCKLVSSEDIQKFKGENFSFKCPTAEDKALGVYLFSRREDVHEVLYYYFEDSKLTLHENYKGRIEVNADNKTLTINIFNLQLKDTGAYWCTCNIFQSTCQMTDKGVFILVNEIPIESASSTANNATGMRDFLIPVTALTAGSVLLLLILVAVVWMLPKIKEQRRRKGEDERRHTNGIYEEMRCNKNSL
ncbi:uncharacterized protein LOC127652648 [Xyrauchen texanus]|uniref:uncharacterized protein LOC127652648 n=1 Tax=Xyrauchen texanus TaxID=154827 RepID=UPI0022423DB1|nr:uncharacterized protein LOC127652648 [Xyrauchen texanus]